MSKLTWCWCCGWKRFEWLGWRISWQRRFKCFFCRIDTLDAKYGPSETAELNRQLSKDKKFKQPSMTRWEIRRFQNGKNNTAL